MKNVVLTLTLALTTFLLVGAQARVFAAPVIAQTWVGGTIKDSSNNPIPGGGSGDNVTVTCNGHVQVVPFDAAGNYGATYPQTDCKAGDEASAIVAIAEGSGSNSGTVQNTTVNGPVVDLDVIVLDISVPEFGAVGAGVTGMASVAGYLYLKAKSVLK